MVKKWQARKTKEAVEEGPVIKQNSTPKSHLPNGSSLVKSGRKEREARVWAEESGQRRCREKGQLERRLLGQPPSHYLLIDAPLAGAVS